MDHILLWKIGKRPMCSLVTPERWREEIILVQGAGDRTARKRSLLLKSAFLRCQFVLGVEVSRFKQFGLVPLLDLRLFDV